MDKLENQIAELFSKPVWTEQDWQMIKDLLEQQSPGSMQPFFQEHYISELAKDIQPPSVKARDLLEQIHKKAGIQDVTTPVISLNRRHFWNRIAVAASILIVVGISSYLMFFNQPAEQNHVVKNEIPADIKAPETNRAMITLSDGRTVYLDSAGNGTLAAQSGTNVIKTADGQIAYQIANGEISKEIQYNTLTNPRGSKVIDMQLSDGSRIWLNAGSSVRYPVKFLGNERKVSISGEAYFEVAHDATKPFKVIKGGLEVTVLGTHFNVNAYDDETEIKVTLLEGSVKVSTPEHENKSTTLKPGQQAILTLNSKLSTLNNVDTEQVMAWKNGLFKFNDVDIETMMRQIERWYDVSVVYQGMIPHRTFRGEIDRNLPISKVLQMLEFVGIQFKIDGKKIVIMP